MNERLIVTIDGPSGAGKSTVSKALAAKLGYFYLDTGAMYRALAWKVHQEETEKGSYHLDRVLENFEVGFSFDQGATRIHVDSRDITEEIRQPHISMLASRLSALKQVRTRLTQLQRMLGSRGGVVAEGRDMGTVVFPQAQVKFYLVADLEERAKRRHRELLGQGLKVNFHQVLKDMELRDRQDSTRELAPLKPAADAVLIDSTHLSPEDVLEVMFKIVQQRACHKHVPCACSGT